MVKTFRDKTSMESARSAETARWATRPEGSQQRLGNTTGDSRSLKGREYYKKGTAKGTANKYGKMRKPQDGWLNPKGADNE